MLKCNHQVTVGHLILNLILNFRHLIFGKICSLSISVSFSKVGVVILPLLTEMVTGLLLFTLFCLW